MIDNDNILSGPDMYQTYEVACAVNTVNAKVEALKRMFGRHEAADGGQAADGAEALVTLVDNLAAERDALRAKADKHEKEMIDYIEAAAMYQRRTADLRAERDAAQARVAELEADAALGSLVRRMPEGYQLRRMPNHWSHAWVAGLVAGMLIWGESPDDALRAALDKEATDAH